MNKEIEQINELIESLNFAEARILCEKALEKEKNPDILDIYADVLLNLDEADSAYQVYKINPKQALEMSIKISPNSNGDKYMSLAQLSEPQKAYKLYSKGLEVYINQFNDKKDDNLRSLIASGYASIAELFMTTDLW